MSSYLLRVPSTLDQLEIVDAEIERVAAAMGFSVGARADLGICVSEAAANAMVHAHHERADLFVEIRWEQLPGALRVSVRDYGGGFDSGGIPDPTLPENLLKEHGRGLHLIHSLMDRVEVIRHPDGTSVVMTKNLPSS
ncbi:MAG: ATP-binding protein [bacterium]|nr:ATP-binding protein [bacterium]